MNLPQSTLTPGEKSSVKTAIEEVCASLRADILAGQLEPGSRLRIEELRQRFGVGSSTVREAVSRLLVENLVTTQGQRGFHVAPVSVEDFRDIGEMRALLEAQALRESIQTGDDDWESRLVAAHHRLKKIETVLPGHELANVVEWEKRNREFHNAMIAACSNRWLLQFRETLYNHSIRYLHIAINDRTIPRDVRAEHQEIFDAVIDRDADLAEKLAIAHIRKSVSVIEARFTDRQGES